MSLKTPLSLLLIGTLASAGATFMAGAAIAQTSSEIDPLDGLATDDDGSDFLGDDSSPFDIIHRAVLRPTMNSDEFQQQQQTSINSEAESFRLRQQEALRQQQAPAADEASELTITEDEAL